MFATAAAIAFDYALLANDGTLQGLVTGGRTASFISRARPTCGR